MKAATYKPELGAGYVAVLDHNVKLPFHNDKQMLIKVEAAAINPVDYKLNSALFPFIRFFLNKVPGMDVSGTIISLGKHENCEDFKLYDSVFGLGSGSVAEYTQMSCNKAVKKPKNLKHTQAAALPIGFLTSLSAFDVSNFSFLSQKKSFFIKQKEQKINSSLRAAEKRQILNSLSKLEEKKIILDFTSNLKNFNFNKNRSLVVVGGSGGCGSFGIQLGKIYGFNEIISINSKKNNDFVISQGATKTINYKDKSELNNFIDYYKNNIDFIYDTVTSADSKDTDYYSKLHTLLKQDDTSKYIQINGFKSDFFWFGMLRPVLVQFLDFIENILKVDYNLVDLLIPDKKFDLIITDTSRLQFETMAKIFETNLFEGKVKIDTIYEMQNTADIVSAFMKLKSRRTVGKIVLTP